ncbi:SDR family NAD(P)-dependent oxidoreductase [Sphingomonas colocasiae]|uniref:SDR family oxidoreductase n=1 Tax=Sphingomonas colocasiae TaxID=1848973 RepID=A0ABS7PQL1_9SPHN|nr:SDR family NAD(P)-dependent oxidoreductase [Sphingomonas colocasiae]MBY8823518.1 SDR family oxidoreductase [Sphingomonas colocasiae]
MQLSGKVALITGAGAGIGQATARLFAERGAKVVATDLDEAGLAETVQDVSGGIETLVSDATSAADAARAVALAQERFGGLHFLINVVGGSRPGKTVVEFDEEEWDFWVRLNLTSTFLMCRAAIPAIAAAGGGSIVNVASGAGVTGMGRNPAYVAAKGGVIALTRSLAIDHAAESIRANCIAPGPILTPLMKRNRSEQEIAFMSKLSLVGRLGKPEEIASTAAFLCSEDAGFINGELINVAGGRGGPI